MLCKFPKFSWLWAHREWTQGGAAGGYAGAATKGDPSLQAAIAAEGGSYCPSFETSRRSFGTPLTVALVPPLAPAMHDASAR